MCKDGEYQLWQAFVQDSNMTLAEVADWDAWDQAIVALEQAENDGEDCSRALRRVRRARVCVYARLQTNKF